MTNINKFFLLLILSMVPYLSAIAKEDPEKITKLTKKADIILTGKVIHKQSNWNDNKTRIYTKTAIQVDEFLKGKVAGNSVDVIYPGGEVGEVGELYTHMPTFQNNEEVLVFLKKDKKNKGYKVLDGQDGKIRILKKENSKDKISASNSSINDLKSLIKQTVNKQK
jgi:vacuolar-type H+-ATPase subunit I/STV1